MMLMMMTLRSNTENLPIIDLSLLILPIFIALPHSMSIVCFLQNEKFEEGKKGKIIIIIVVGISQQFITEYKKRERIKIFLKCHCNELVVDRNQQFITIYIYFCDNGEHILQGWDLLRVVLIQYCYS